MMARAVLVCPGQGSQRPGMLSAVPEVDGFDRLLDAAEALTGLELRTIEALGSPDDLADTRVAQPLLYLADWAWGMSLLDSGLQPSLMAGHSLGELAALALADVFSVEAGLELVVERSKLMAHAAMASDGAMAAVLGLDTASVTEAVSGIDGVWVANDNAPGQVVVSGRRQLMAEAVAAIEAAGARRVVTLSVSGAFHSPLMQPAAAAFADLLRGADFSDASIPVVQNTLPEPETCGDVIRERLIDQMVSPVRWTDTMHVFVSDGPVVQIEAGPGAVLTGLAKRVDLITALSVESAGIEAVMTEVSSTHA